MSSSAMAMTQRASLASFDAPVTAAPPLENAEDLNRIIEEELKVCPLPRPLVPTTLSKFTI